MASDEPRSASTATAARLRDASRRGRDRSAQVGWDALADLVEGRTGPAHAFAGVRLHTDGVPARVARLSGELDLFDGPEVEAVLTRLACAIAPQVLEVDLRELGFIDSTGLRALAHAHLEAMAAGGGIALRLAPGTAPQRVLEMLGLDQQFAPLSQLAAPGGAEPLQA